MKKSVLILLSIIFLMLDGCKQEEAIIAKVSEHPKTFCNPISLDYRFMIIEGGDGIREAADPVVQWYKDEYLLFASKSSGYWYSKDFVNWTHVIVPDSVLPIEDYAPATFVHNDYVYYVGSTRGKAMLYRSNNPNEGKWEPVQEIWSYWDPAFYIEGDNLYLSYGCSPTDPIHLQVLDLNTLKPKSEVLDCFNSDIEKHGWERPGEQNELLRRPYIEGSWMTENNGKYYLQYATPGTEWKTYADGAYISDSPTGPFQYIESSPVSYKPAGFIDGAGHGCMFKVNNQWWKVATNSISIRHNFERRISFYPAGFDQKDNIYTNTYLGDYPLYLPGTKLSDTENRPGWMLLSYHKPVTASSSLAGYPVENIVDEEVRTAWVAEGNKDEWVQIDLEAPADIYAIQINYDEYAATQKGVNPNLYQSYVIYASNEGNKWYTIADYSQKRTDCPHDYIEFEAPFQARYIKWVNKDYSVSDTVSLREIRIFGKGKGELPQKVHGLMAERDKTDGCKATVTWNKVDNATGYVVRYGIKDDELYHSHQVMESSSLTITALNKGVPYFFTVDAYNENGITPGADIISLE